MNMLEILRTKKPEVYFSDWEYNKAEEITLVDFLNAKEKQHKNTKYFVFLGFFNEKNHHRIKPMKYCYFHISKNSFLNEIIKHIDTNIIDPTKSHNIRMIFKRTDKTHIQIDLLTDRHTNVLIDGQTNEYTYRQTN